MTEPAQPIPGERLPIRFFDIFVPVLVVFLATLGLILAGVGAAIALKADPELWTRLDPTLVTAQTEIVAILAVTGLLYVAMLFALWAICRRRGPFTFAGYFGRFRPREFLLGGLCGALLACGVTVMFWALDTYKIVTIHNTPNDAVLNNMHAPLELALSLAVIGFIGPLAEEVYFRGLLLAWMRRWFWLPLAAVVDAAFFSFVHGENLGHPGAEGWILSGIIATIGLLNVIFYLRTRSLWMPVGLHMFYNSALVLSAYFF
ncbi:MAG TPA: CPBP family intramembrane glutamic endopeptidase [Rhizomicrobium sp.]|nr:CPBP family intramembrane glutamic endopeptidase [Rhizomicrobium sp.]